MNNSILITGGKSFIGKKLYEHLLNNTQDQICLINRDSILKSNSTVKKFNILVFISWDRKADIENYNYLEYIKKTKLTNNPNIIFFSTISVYQDIKTGYPQNKLNFETMLKNNYKNLHILRIGIIYGIYDYPAFYALKNFMKKIPFKLIFKKPIFELYLCYDNFLCNKIAKIIDTKNGAKNDVLINMYSEVVKFEDLYVKFNISKSLKLNFNLGFIRKFITFLPINNLSSKFIILFSKINFK